MMKRSTKTALNIVALVLLMAGMTVLLYPRICQFFYDHEAGQITSNFSRRMDEAGKNSTSDGDLDRLKELMVQYNKELYKNGQNNLVDAFSYQQIDFSLKQFGFDEEMIGYITIPKMGMELPIYLGANSENLEKGAALLTQTSLPVGGVNTNAVIAAHRGFYGTAMFRDIENLEIGNIVIITNFREKLYYQVAQIKTIDPYDIEQILIQEGRDLVTLITCHPYQQPYQRYVIYCERIRNDVKQETETGIGLTYLFKFNELSPSQKSIFVERWLPVAIVLLLLLLVIILLIFRIVKRRKKKTSSAGAKKEGNNQATP